MRLYVDDVRRTGDRTSAPHEYWERTYGYADTIARLEAGGITHISLDHDLDGDGELSEELTGYDIATWIEASAHAGTLAPMTWEVHSMNPSGASRIRAAMSSATRIWEGRNS
jgi:hypothetical protein